MVKEQPPHKVEIWRRPLKEVAFGLMESGIRNQPAKDTGAGEKGHAQELRRSPG